MSGSTVTAKPRLTRPRSPRMADQHHGKESKPVEIEALKGMMNERG